MWNVVTTLLLVHLLCLGVIGKSPNYCSDSYNCTVGKMSYKHVMCYPLPKRRVCDYFGVIDMETVRSLMLKLHNQVRDLMTRKNHAEERSLPKACHMSTMSWEPQYHWFAERWTKSCLQTPGKCRSTGDVKASGQNWGTIEITDSLKRDPERDMETIFTRWLNSFYNAKGASDLVTKYVNGTWAAGSQILWANTAKVGCSYLGYSLPKDHNKAYLALVCIYSPAGNIPGQEIYRTDCEKGTLELSRSGVVSTSGASTLVAKSPLIRQSPHAYYEYDYSGSPPHIITDAYTIGPTTTERKRRPLDEDEYDSESYPRGSSCCLMMLSLLAVWLSNRTTFSIYW